jgi:hypothetical protein
LDANGEVKEAHGVRDGGPRLPCNSGDLLLRHAEFVRKAAVCLRGFDWGEIAALNILNQREFKA